MLSVGKIIFLFGESGAGHKKAALFAGTQRGRLKRKSYKLSRYLKPAGIDAFVSSDPEHVDAGRN